LSAPPLDHGFVLASQERVVLRLIAEHRLELLVELDLDSFRGRGAQVFNHHCGPVACRAGILPAGAGHGGLVAADGGLEGRPTMGGTRVGPASLA
jgi:hypothetical protein